MPARPRLKFDYHDPFTFAAWIKPDEPKGAILSRGEDYFEGKGHGLYLIDGKLRLHVTFRWTDLGDARGDRRPAAAQRVAARGWSPTTAA